LRDVNMPRERGPQNDFIQLGTIEERHIDLEHESIELRSRQWIGAFLFQRVLCREYEKWLLQMIGGAGRGDAAFLHRLEQRGLRLRRCPVDFVRQQDLSEDRPAAELKDVPA